MRYYAIFYRKNVQDGSYMDVLGDRGLIRLDGRLARRNMSIIARLECSKRGFDGYRIARGDNLLNLFYLNAAVVEV